MDKFHRPLRLAALFCCLLLCLLPQVVHAAATITIGSCSLASDGKTLTATISGGSGTGYAPVSGVTGLTPHATIGGYSNTYLVSSATISGSTLTVTINGAIPSSATATAVSIDLAAGSNITDSAANTATGQTAVAVTNNSAKAATAFNIGSVSLVYPACVTATNNGTYTAFTSTANGNKEFAVNVYGTDCTMNLYSSAKISVDGGSFTTYSQSGFFQCPIYGGLTDGWHQVIVNQSANIYDTASVVAMSPTTPNVGSALSWYGTSYRMMVASTKSAVKSYGAWVENSSYDSMRTGGYWGNGLILRTTSGATGLRVFGYNSSNTLNYAAYVDGAFYSTGTLSLNWSSAALVSGLTPGVHTINIRQLDTNHPDTYITTVQVVGGLLDTSNQPNATGLTLTAAGDSITQNSNSDSPASALAYIAQIGSKYGYTVNNVGHQGDLTPTTQDVPNAILLHPPTVLFVYYGTNDEGSLTATQFQANMTNFLQLLVNGTTLHSGLNKSVTQHVYVLAPWAYVTSLNSAYTAALSNAVAAVVPSSVSPPFSVIQANTLAAAVAGANPHPSNAQDAQIAAILAAYAKPVPVFRPASGQRLGSRSAD